MAAPQIRVFVDFDSDTAFETNPLILGSATKGILGTNKLGSGTLPVEITSLVDRVSIRRGRNRISSKFEPGTCDVFLYDQTGNWNPSNVNGAYYPNLVPLKQIIVYATYLGVDYYLFSGFIQSYDTSFWQGTSSTSQVTLRCVDSFRLFAGALVSTVSSAPAGQDSGARVSAILDQINFPLSQRNIQTGNSTLQADPGTSRNVLDALQQVENSEFGGIFLDGYGDVNFKNRTSMIKAPSTAIYTFADDGTAISYQDAAVAFDDTTLLNSVTVTRSGGTAQNAQDATSITSYFIHSGERSDILVQTDAEALNQAQAILATRKDPEPRIDSIMLNLYDDLNPNKPKSGIDIDLLDGIIVKKKMPGSTTFTQESVVIGINHDITKQSFMTTLFTSEPLLSGFVLDSSIDGIIGTDVLAY
jgi:hypothetical protein